MPLISKPAAVTEWASNLVNVIDPGALKKDSGFVVEKPAHQHVNWIFNNSTQWERYYEAYTDTISNITTLDDGNGRIGIGITPETDLHILSSVGTNSGNIQLGNTEANEAFKLRYDGVNNWFTIQGSAGAGFSNMLTIDRDSGDVGIGVSLPDAKLHVFSGESGVLGSGSGDFDDFIIENNGYCGMSVLCPDASISTINFGTPTDATAFQIKWDYSNLKSTVGTFVAGADLSFVSGNGVENMTLSSSGRLGIGTDSPKQPLHILNGTTHAILDAGVGARFESSGADFYLNFVVDDGDTTHINFGDQSDTDIGGIRYNHTDNQLILKTVNTDALVINSNSNIGIGTDTPTEKLTIETTRQTVDQGISINPSTGGSKMSIVNTGDFTGTTATSLVTASKGSGIFFLGQRQNATDYRNEAYLVNIEDDGVTVNQTLMNSNGAGAISGVVFSVSGGQLKVVTGSGSTDTTCFGMWCAD